MKAATTDAPTFEDGRCTLCGGVERADHDCYDPECELCGARPQDDPAHMLINGCDQCGSCYDAHRRRTSVAFATPMRFDIATVYDIGFECQEATRDNDGAMSFPLYVESEINLDFRRKLWRRNEGG